MEDLLEHILDQIGDHVSEHEIRLGELSLTVQREAIIRVLTFLRDDSAVDCKLLLDVAGVDYPERPERFEIVYILLSVRQNHRLKVKVRTDEDTPVPSVAGVCSVTPRTGIAASNRSCEPLKLRVIDIGAPASASRCSSMKRNIWKYALPSASDIAAGSGWDVAGR